MEELAKKISNENLDANIKTLDIFYEYIYKNNKIEKREEKVIIITTPIMESKLSDKNINNYYIDVTYRIIPNKNNKYKLMTISCTDKDNTSFICALILLKYEDNISFEKIF